MTGAFLAPFTPEGCYSYVSRLGILDALASLDRNGTRTGPLDVQDGTPLRQKCGKLLALKLANFELSLRHDKYGYLGAFAEALDVIHIAVTDHPCNSLCNCGFSDAGKSYSGHGFN